MASKQDALDYIKKLAEQKLISKRELEDAYDSGLNGHDGALSKKIGIADILYYIGAAIIVLGIAILLAQNWTTLSFPAKILATLGTGIAAYVVGLLFAKDARTESVGTVFYMISALVLPIGFFVLVDNAGLNAGTFGNQTLISSAVLIIFLVSFLVLRKSIFLLFSIIFGTWLFFSFANLIADSGLYFDFWHFDEYLLLATGTAYMLLGYAFSRTSRSGLTGFLYSFGVLGFLLAAITLGGYHGSAVEVFWELIYPILVFAVLFLSVKIKSKSFLVFGTIFLMAYIIKITSEYFSSGLGWPVALVIAGLAMIAVGYMSITIKKKYLNA